MILSPKRLHHGDRVAIIAPAAQFKADELLQGLDLIKEMGLRPVLGPSTRRLNTDVVYDSSLEDRVREFMWAVNNDDIHGIISVIGGFGSAELLPHLDYTAIRRSRKVFVGKSDLTAINCGILKNSGLISVNGKTAVIRKSDSGQFVDCDFESLRHTLRLLMSDERWGTEAFKPNQFVPRRICSGPISGRVIGGNLETLTCLLGTKFFPDPTGAVLFLEDVRKNSINISRRLLHLKMAGVLDKISGAVIGEFAEVDETNNGHFLIAETLQRYFSKIPSVYGYSFSHGTHIMPVPIGANVSVDDRSDEVNFDFKME